MFRTTPTIFHPNKAKYLFIQETGSSGKIWIFFCPRIYRGASIVQRTGLGFNRIPGFSVRGLSPIETRLPLNKRPPILIEMAQTHSADKEPLSQMLLQIKERRSLSLRASDNSSKYLPVSDQWCNRFSFRWIRVTRHFFSNAILHALFFGV